MASKITDSNDSRVQAFLGTKIAKLTALRFVRMHAGCQMWEFQCDCGNTTIARKQFVLRGTTTSCGCVGRTCHKTHGYRKDNFYGVWSTMIQRVTNPNLKCWKNYGGRGITVCERWLKFENFLEDMMPTYKKGLCLERKDNDGPYSPENCCWETRSKQNRNKRSARLITFNGITLNLVDWSSRLDLNHVSLIRRLKSWSLEKALTTPKRLCHP
jgi:hypothetical protein